MGLKALFSNAARPKHAMLSAPAGLQCRHDFWVCRQLIYDPREWDIGEEEAIAQIQVDELSRCTG